MSSCSVTTISCPGCGGSQEFTLWQSLNVDLNPGEGEKLLSGELTRFVCEVCGHSSEVAYPLLYHDMSRRLMIYLTPGGPVEEELGTADMGRMMTGYRFRRVGSRNDLLEKVKVFGEDLNDCVVEVFKLALRRQMGVPDESALYFAGRDADEDGKEALQFVHFSEEGRQDLGVELGDFSEFAQTFAPLCGAQTGEGSEWPVVSVEFAQGVLSQLSTGK